ncbi:MAG: outer membrane lipoprotein-sorting protein [Pseudomonadota bacterium]
MKALVIALTLLLSLSAHAEKGFDIMKKAEVFNNGFLGESAEMQMILINAHGDKVERKMKSKVKETQSDGDKSIITFLWPADVKGTKMLTWSHKEGNDDQWLYLPALKRVKRITSRNKTGSFMGSEFSYEDLGSQEVEKYTYKYIKDETVDGRKVWIIERMSTDKNSGYSKEVVFMDQEYQNPLKIEYFDRKKELLKLANFTGYKKYGKFWRYDKITFDGVFLTIFETFILKLHRRARNLASCHFG